MQEPETQPTPSVRPYLRPVLTWIGVVGALSTAVAFGMTWLSDNVSLDSAAETTLQSAAPGPGNPGAPAAPGAAAGGVPGVTADFRLATLDGGMAGPPDYRGKVVVAELWATWCGPCRLQAKFLEQVHRDVGDKVQFLAINSGESTDTVRKFQERDPFPYPVLLDPQQSVQSQYRITGLPTLFVIDANGKVTFQNTGVVNAATLRREIEKARGSA